MGIQREQSKKDYNDVFQGVCSRYDLLIIMDYSQMSANGNFHQDGIFTVVQPLGAVENKEDQQKYYHYVAEKGATNDTRFTLTCLIKLLTCMYFDLFVYQ